MPNTKLDYIKQVKNKHIVDVRDYGAVGDGVTDDTDAIQEAIDAGAGKTIYFPKPTSRYLISSALNINQEGTTVVGAGRETCIYSATSSIFNVTAGGADISGFDLMGNRQSGQVGITCSGSRCLFHDLRLDLLDGGFLNSGGFHNKYVNIWGRNLKSYVGKLSNGVSPYLDTITYDTDISGYDVCSEGGIIVQTEGCYLFNLDILHAYDGLLIQPNGRDIEWIFVYHCRFDQNFNAGVHIVNNTIYRCRGIWFTGLWSASTGNNGTHGGVAPAGDNGIGVKIEGTGNLDQIRFHNCVIFNHRKMNVALYGAATRVYFHGCDIAGGNTAAAAGIDSCYIECTGKTAFDNCEFTNASGSSAFRAAITAAGACGPLRVGDNTFDDSSAAWTNEAIYNVATTQGNVTCNGYNAGLDDVSFSVASTNTVSLPPRKWFALLGTNPVDDVLPTWLGREVFFQKPDAGTNTFSTSGNFATGWTLGQGESAQLVWSGIKWIVKKQ